MVNRNVPLILKKIEGYILDVIREIKRLYIYDKSL